MRTVVVLLVLVELYANAMSKWCRCANPKSRIFAVSLRVMPTNDIVSNDVREWLAAYERRATLRNALDADAVLVRARRMHGNGRLHGHSLMARRVVREPQPNPDHHYADQFWALGG